MPKLAERHVMTIPPPANGTHYTQDDVARIQGVSRHTVASWTQRGVSAGPKGTVRLRTLRTPRGRVAPAALCEFLGTLNGMVVEVEAHERGNRCRTKSERE